MSLVAYDYGSDGESGDDEPDETSQSLPAVKDQLNGTDPPKMAMEIDDGDDESPKQHLHLPAPKKTNDLNVEEEDDEFLHKKAIPADISLPKPPSTLNLPSKPNVRNGKVQITIPSMKEFMDGEDEMGARKKGKPVIGAALPTRTTNLLSLLPKPRSEIFTTPAVASASTSGSSTASTSFSKRLVPDSVANRPRSVPKSALKPNNRSNNDSTEKPSKPTQATNSDEDDDDGDDSMVDFFSFNKVEQLPTVSSNEINAMVAKKAAKIAENVRKYTEPEPEYQPIEMATNIQPTQTEFDPSEDLASETALSALIGGNRAKRARLEEVDLIEITSDDIVPSKADFLRRQLQDETGYVPTGHLVGDWTCTSKRKSHITQLANKAQANAQELEAMWAANRQSRRQTQSKYGF